MFDWITGIISSMGYIGILLLMFLENIFPPIPSELIMPLAGFQAAQGQLNVILVLAAGTLGSILGALPWYYAGKMLGCDRLKRLADRHGRWFTMSGGDIDQVMGWFDRHGKSVVFFGRLIPTIRTLISVPAGVIRMGLVPFLLFSTAGTALWTGLLVAAGYVLQSQYNLVSDWLNPVSTGIVVLIALFYLYLVVTWKPATAKG